MNGIAKENIIWRHDIQHLFNGNGRKFIWKLKSISSPFATVCLYNINLRFKNVVTNATTLIKHVGSAIFSITLNKNFSPPIIFNFNTPFVYSYLVSILNLNILLFW